MSETYILAVGDIAADLLIQIPSLPVMADSLVFAKEIGLEPGGCANFLIAANRLGVPTKAVGALGQDNWGNQVAAILQDEAVDLVHVVRQGSTTLVTVLVDQNGQHAFVGKFGEGDELLFSEAHRQLVGNAAALFVTGYSLNEVRLRGLALEMMACAGKTAVSCYLDPGPSFTHLPKAVQMAAIKNSQVLLFTEEETPLVEIENVTDLLAYGPEILVVKKGELGCVVYTQNEMIEVPGFAVTVVDTTAAGDSFAAGFVVASSRGNSLIGAATYANKVGAVAVQKVGGGRNVPTLMEIEQISSSFSDDTRQVSFQHIFGSGDKN